MESTFSSFGLASGILVLIVSCDVVMDHWKTMMNFDNNQLTDVNA